MTTCRIRPNASGAIELVSLDTGLADSFPNMQALRAAPAAQPCPGRLSAAIFLPRLRTRYRLPP